MKKNDIIILKKIIKYYREIKNGKIERRRGIKKTRIYVGD